MISEENKIFSGTLFCPIVPELKAAKLRSHNLSQAFSALREDEVEERQVLALQILQEFGADSFMQGPIFFHYGKHTRIGKRCFINYNFTCQDDALVSIGDDCCFGPNVTIVTAMHPLLPDERRLMENAEGERRPLCYAKPVAIGKNCWLGANVLVCPGVVIGENCVIGAGSVVTRDVPPNSLAFGVPCHVARQITETDSMLHHPEILADNRSIPVDS